jgi:very-short-patch-repair endonuclease
MANTNARTLRKNQTEAEKRLWRYLRLMKADGLHFRRQTPMGNYIADFCCHSARMIIEVDGGQHNEAAGISRDVERTAWLQSQGYHVLRFWNNDVLGNIDGVMQTITRALKGTPTPTPPHKGEGLSSEDDA